jgi:type III pantothenate kinase
VTDCLQLDVGNSSAKWRLMHSDQLVVRGNYRSGDAGALAALLHCCERPDAIWVSSVASPATEQEMRRLFTDRWGVEPWFARTQACTGSLRNSYVDPGRMGVDRWLAMLGARRRVSGRFCVVDAGSALTIDTVGADGRHEGGYIIPGAALMERALLLDTDRVRFDEATDFALSPGTSTAEAVRHGIALAQAGAVAMALNLAGTEPVTLFYCGGDGENLLHLVGRGGHWVPDLVFEGLQVMAALR